MNKEEYIALRIELKLIGKIAHHRLMIRDLFRKRHGDVFGGLIMSQCMHHVNELRVWLRMAELISDNPIKPYETYYAEELTKNK